MLAVEGDPSLRELMKRALHQRGYAIAVAETAADALRECDSARPPFDVVIIGMVLSDRLGPARRPSGAATRPSASCMRPQTKSTRAQIGDPGCFL